jgi:hypothetical protein
MSDKIVPTNGNANLPDHQRRIQDLMGGMANIQNSIAEAGGVASAFPFIGINGDGIWAYGQDRTEVQEGSLWAIDIRTWQHGYIAWPPNTSKERKPLGERMVPASSALPDLASLPVVPVPYQLQFAFELLCMTGEDSGTMALYKNGSYGAKVIIQTLVEEVRKQAKADQTRLCPVVELQIRSYFHQEWKKTIYNPVLQIHKWISFEEFDAFEKVGSGRATETVAETTAVAPQPEPEVVAAAPRAAARGQGRPAAAAPAPEPAPAPGPVPRGRRPSTRSQPAA